MTTKNISVISVDILDEKSKNGRDLRKMEVVYRDSENKTDKKTLVEPYTDKTVWSALEGATKGDTFSVDLEKENGYWQWKGIHRQDAAVGQQSPAKPAPTKPTYETPEERAQRQIFIIRQSSIASAVDLLKDHGKQPDVGKVIQVARAFEAYVVGNTIADMTSDEVE